MESVDWDNICVNPHEAFVAQGREEGRHAGEEAGYREGWRLGQTTALEYGMELGFIRGVIEAVPRDFEENTKAGKTLRDLRQALDKFPDAEAAFRQQQMASTTDNDGEQPGDGGEENVRQLIQRIRARFRLLTVQLKMPKLSLKEILNKSASDFSARDQTTSDW